MGDVDDDLAKAEMELRERHLEKRRLRYQAKMEELRRDPEAHKLNRAKQREYRRGLRMEREAKRKAADLEKERDLAHAEGMVVGKEVAGRDLDRLHREKRLRVEAVMGYYAMMLGDSLSMSHRREWMNLCVVALNCVALALAALLAGREVGHLHSALFAIGAGTCWWWGGVLKGIKQLNGAKFHVINKMGEAVHDEVADGGDFPSPYEQEWVRLGHGENPSRNYRLMTSRHRPLLWYLMFLHLAVFALHAWEMKNGYGVFSNFSW